MDQNRPLSHYHQREIVLVAVKILLAFLGILLLLTVIYLMSHVFILLFISVLLAAAMRPIVLFAQRRKIPKVLMVLLVYVVLIAVLIGTGRLVIPLLTTQLGLLITSAPQRYADLYAGLKGSSSMFAQQLSGSLPDPANLGTGQLPSGTDFSGILSHALDIGSFTVNFVVETVSTLVLALYWVVEQPRFERLVLSLLPAADRPRYLVIWRQIESKLGAYLRGIGIQCLSIGLMVAIGYFILGVQYFAALGILTALFEAIPLLGPFLGAIPALLVASTQGPDKIALVLIFTLVVQEIEAQILVPKVMERAVGVSPLVTLLSMLGFGSVLGLLGVFLAIPFAAVLQVLVEYFVLNKEETVPEGVFANTPIDAAKRELARLQLLLRARYRSSDDMLDPERSVDLEHRLEQIVEQVNALLEQAPQSPETIGTALSLSGVEALSPALAQVHPLLEEAKVTVEEMKEEKNSPDLERLIRSADEVLRNASQVLATPEGIG